MSTHKNIDLICVAVILLGLILTVLFMNGEALGLQRLVDEDTEAYEGTEHFTANDLNGDWDTDGATVIALDGSGASVSGNGAYYYDGNVVIAGAGRYVLSGSLDGGVVVDAYSSSKVWLKFDGVTLTNTDDACLRVEQADKVFLTLAGGTTNTLTCGGSFSEAAVDAGRDGAVFARDDLTINGAGALTVTSGYRHGIAANDDLVITGGTISVTAARDAIHVNDSLRVRGASLTLSGQDEGIDVDAEGGYLYIESGTLGVTGADDGIHTEGDITIAGGSVSVAAGDDGIHSGTAIAISDGTVLISECYEGIEAPQIDISGGDVTIYPSDDGLNANGGSGDMFGGGMMGGGGMMMGGGMPGGRSGPDAETETGASETPAVTEDTDSADDTLPCIHISGGTLTIINENAQDADGIDSNGSIYISGGTIRVAMGGNGYALDVGSESGGVMEISGGDLIGCGSYAMAESFDASSTQPSILYTCSAGAPAGTTVALEDADGNIIISYEAPCSFSCVNLSCPEMLVGETYLMVIGENVEEITVSEVSASYGDAQSGGFGGTFTMGGGMRSRDDFNGGGFSGGGRGRGGNRSGSDGEASGEMPDFGGERPDFGGEMPEMPDTSGMPTPPDMSGMPEMPDTSDMPTPPDMSGMPEMPDASGMPEMGDFDFGGGTPDMSGAPGAQQTAGGTEAAEATAEAEPAGYGADVWLWAGISLAVLLAGLAFAFVFKKH